MEMTISILCGFIAVEHVYFLILEMFLWQKPLGLKTFGNTKEKAAISAVLAANQGLYNGFLAAGLVCTFFLEGVFQWQGRMFFSSCVLVAGLYGGWSASPRIYLVQGLPAAVALALLLLSR